MKLNRRDFIMGCESLKAAQTAEGLYRAGCTQKPGAAAAGMAKHALLSSFIIEEVFFHCENRENEIWAKQGTKTVIRLCSII